MRIAVIGTRGGGPCQDGVDRALAEICPRLARRGHSIDLFSERNGRAIANVTGARTIRMPGMPLGFNDAASHALISSLATAFRGYDVVNFVAAETSGLFTLAAKLGLHRTVVSVHGLDRPSGFPVAPLFGPESIAARFADVITVVSKRLERFFRDAYGRETIYIPNGVTASPEPDPALVTALGLTPGNYLLIADRMVASSGAHDAVTAINTLAGNCKLVLAELGDGDEAYRHALWRDADHDRVVFVGRMSGPVLEALMAHAYLFLLPSTADEAPPTLLQALAHGRAVVVSDQTEHMDVVGAEGFTFTSGDPMDLKRVLAWLLDDPEVVARMRLRAGATAATRYCWDRIAEAYEQVYLSIV
ncbi:MAG: glycosyltransferase family 4 protein [Solirubrobacterales bacterium]